MFRFVRTSKVAFRLTQTLYDVLNTKTPLIKEEINFGALGINVLHAKHFCSFQITGMPNENENEEPDIIKITGGDSELEHKLRVIILETSVMRQEGRAVPTNRNIKNDQWKELLKLSSMSARKRYLQYLFKLEKIKENRTKKKEQKRIEWEQMPKPEQDDTVLNHNLGHNNFFLRIYDTTINQMYNNRLIQAIQFGQKLVVDCGYGNNMTKRENSNCAKQLMLLFAENRLSDHPFDLHFCNTIPNGDLMQNLNKFIKTMYEPWFPLNIHERSYREIFPKQKLLYLTPHCREVMTEFDHDAVYIIGALVDKVNSEPLSLAKAKQEGIRMAKLPLDRYLEWGSGSGKSLTINQVIAILLDIKQTGDWQYALRHVPRRKLMMFSEATVKRKFNKNLDYTSKSWQPNKLSFNRRKDDNKRLIDLKRVIKE